MMYEPPNRGGKTWTGLARVSGGGNDPAAIVDPAVLANAFFMPRGYTLVWSGWENDLGAARRARRDRQLPRRHEPRRLDDHRPVLRVHRDRRRLVALAYPAATLDKTKAKLTRRVHLDDVPQPVRSSRMHSGWNYNASTALAISLGAAGTSSTTTSTSSPTPPKTRR